MSMEHTERKLVELGDADLAKIQAGLHEAFKKRHPGLEDIAYPSVVTPVEAKAVAQIAETAVPLVVEPLLSSEQLIRTESEALKRFFGKDIGVSEPPQELFQTLEKMSKLDITGFEPHFLPQVSLTEKSKLPGWKVKPESWFWQRIKDGKISEDTAILQEGWYLVDGRRKPDYDNGQQRYDNDYIEPIMADLRKTGKIQEYSSVPEISRFGASPDEIEQIVFPEVTSRTGIKGNLTNKRYIEFNVWGNMFHPEWGQTDTAEWFADKFGGSSRLVGGFSGVGGLAGVDHDWSGRRDGGFAFGPVVRFPSKP